VEKIVASKWFPTSELPSNGVTLVDHHLIGRRRCKLAIERMPTKRCRYQIDRTSPDFLVDLRGHGEFEGGEEDWGQQRAKEVNIARRIDG